MWDTLPHELINAVLDFNVDSLSSAIHVCSHWSHCLEARLYVNPRLMSTDAFTLFVETILARPDLAETVRILDLTKVIGTLKTVKLPLLMKACINTREFYAPQAAFTPYMVQALPDLVHLRILDLANVTERFEISRVVNNCVGLKHLHTLRYPRCAVSTLYAIKQYPPGLRHLSLRGGMKDNFVDKMALPSHPRLAIDSLHIAYAPSITALPMLHLISTISTLTELQISWPIMRFNHNSLDELLTLVPNLLALKISVDYTSPRFFESPHYRLRDLALMFSGVGKHRILTVDDIADALEDESHYRQLKRLSFGKRLSQIMLRDNDSGELLRKTCEVRQIEFAENEDSDHLDSL